MSDTFDHTVHHRDKKSGKIARVTPYSMECHKDLKIYRRDGKCFDGAGREIADPKLVGSVPAPGTQPFTRSQAAAAAPSPAPLVVQDAPNKPVV